MASLSRDRKTGKLRIDFYAPDGTHKTIRLGQVNLSTARTVLHHVEALLSAQIAKAPVPRPTAIWLAGISSKLRDKLARAGLVDTPADSITLKEFCQLYLEKRRLGSKPDTLVKLQDAANKLIGFLGEGKRLTEVTPGDAEDYVHHLREQGLADYTVYKLVQKAKMFFSEAIKRELLERNPFAAVKVSAKIDESKRVFISGQDIEKLMSVLPPIWRVIVALARYGGLRCPSEVLSLKWEHINWEQGTITVPQPKLEHLPGRMYRVTPLFPELRAVLEEAFALAPEGSEYVVWELSYRQKANTARGWRDTNLRTMLYRYLQRAGLPAWPKPFVNMRSSRQTELVDAGFPEHVVASWLGNTPTVARQHYLQVTDEHFRRAVSAPTVLSPGKSAAKSAAKVPLNPPLQRVAPSGKEVKLSSQLQADYHNMPHNVALSNIVHSCPLPPGGLEHVENCPENSASLEEVPLNPPLLAQVIQLLAQLSDAEREAIRCFLNREQLGQGEQAYR